MVENGEYGMDENDVFNGLLVSLLGCMVVNIYDLLEEVKEKVEIFVWLCDLMMNIVCLIGLYFV